MALRNTSIALTTIATALVVVAIPSGASIAQSGYWQSEDIELDTRSRRTNSLGSQARLGENGGNQGRNFATTFGASAQRAAEGENMRIERSKGYYSAPGPRPVQGLNGVRAYSAAGNSTDDYRGSRTRAMDNRGMRGIAATDPGTAVLEGTTVKLRARAPQPSQSVPGATPRPTNRDMRGTPAMGDRGMRGGFGGTRGAMSGGRGRR
jgi:hypothetical protein